MGDYSFSKENMLLVHKIDGNISKWLTVESRYKIFFLLFCLLNFISFNLIDFIFFYHTLYADPMGGGGYKGVIKLKKIVYWNKIGMQPKSVSEAVIQK